MRKRPLLVAAVLGLLFVLALAAPAAHADPSEDEQVAPPLIVRSLPPRAYQPGQDSLATLDDLRREIQAFIEGSEGVVGVALLRGSDELLQVDGETALPLASAAKLVLLLAYLDKLQTEEREPDELEADLLDAMITYSDNDSTDYLWYAIGDAEAMQDYFDRQGMSSAQIVDRDWGESLYSAHDLAYLLTRLSAQHLLDPTRTQYAFDLLSRVFEGQRWGVSAGLDRSETGADAVFLKNGWYPVEEGWRVNSAGLIAPGDGQAPYALVVLSDAQPSFDYGVETIETIASMVNSYMRSQSVGLAAVR